MPARGDRISIVRLWQPNKTFENALAQGDLDGESYIKVMDWIAKKAALTLRQTGRFTVVVQDNCSIHKRDLVRQHWHHWQALGLLLFSLPPLSQRT